MRVVNGVQRDSTTSPKEEKFGYLAERKKEKGNKLLVSHTPSSGKINKRLPASGGSTVMMGEKFPFAGKEGGGTTLLELAREEGGSPISRGEEIRHGLNSRRRKERKKKKGALRRD